MLWVERATVNIGLTLLPDIVKGTPQIPSMEIGNIRAVAPTPTSQAMAGLVFISCANLFEPE